MAVCGPSGASLDAFTSSFQNQFATIRQLLTLRASPDINDEVVGSLEQGITDLEVMLKTTEQQLDTQEQQIARGEAALLRMKEQGKRLEHLADNPPAHLPGPQPNDQLNSTNDNTNKTISTNNSDSSGEPGQGANQSKSSTKKGRRKGSRKSKKLNVPPINYISQDEFTSTPKYMRGRVSQKQVNAAIDELQQVVCAKYKILATKPSSLNNTSLRLFKNWKLQECDESKAAYFFCTDDLKEGKALKLDSSGKNILTVLRHLQRLNMSSSGGLTRYFIL